MMLALIPVGFQGCTPLTSLNLGSESQGLASEEPLPSQAFAKVRITTTGGVAIVSKDDYVTGKVSIDASEVDSALNLAEVSMKIKGRGNSTWGMAKKPYKIKLDKASSVMGMPSDKEWVLLANYSDKTLLRNMLALELGKRLGLAWSPRTQIVEVNLNGADLGTYVLTEQIKVSVSRVNVVNSDPTDVSGGYLLELDQRRDEDQRFETTRTVPYTIKEPEAGTLAQIDYIKNYIQQAEDVLNSNGFADPVEGYAKYVDVDSFINWYLINEIFKNVDSANFSSIYLHKAAGEKLKMGPLWDFDLGAGNMDYGDPEFPEGWWIRSGSPWFNKMFQDPVFAAKVKTRWNALKGQRADLDAILKYIDRVAYSLQISQAKNFLIWDILKMYVWPNRIVTGSYDGEVATMKEWLTTRMKWMDKQFNP